MRQRWLIGYYDPSVVVTYLGVAIAVTGISLAISGRSSLAIVCLLVAAVCDLFDGTVANHVKRNPDEQVFGVQIDSLADLVGFAVLPVVIWASLGFRAWYHLVAFALLVITAITRLAWFNLAAARSTAPQRTFMGVPVIITALVVPILWLYLKLVHPGAPGPTVGAIMTVVAISFVARITIKKPTLAWYGALTLLAAGLAAAVLLVGSGQ